MEREESIQLQRDRERYRGLVREGPAALNDYDRNIAHGGNDELAWASAIAFKYTHIRTGLGRLASIKKLLNRW